MIRYIKIFAPAIIACMIYFFPGICDAQTTSGSNEEFGVSTYTPTYTVIGTYEYNGEIFVVLRNPWGNIEVVEEENYLQMESRNFTTISNAMKARQETAISAIHNLR